MPEWPSIVPGAPEDFYIVINRCGRFGPAFAETSLDRGVAGAFRVVGGGSSE